MPVTFKFNLDIPTASQDPQETIKCYESADGSTGWAEIDSVAVTDLPVTGGLVSYACAPADSSKYHILSPVSALLVEYPLSVQKIIPPSPVTADLFTAYVNTVDVGGDKKYGMELTAQRINSTLDKVAGRMVYGAEKTQTDENGFASIVVLADIGVVQFEVGDLVTFEVDTTGLGGKAVDLSTYV